VWHLIFGAPLIDRKPLSLIPPVSLPVADRAAVRGKELSPSSIEVRFDR
jgi:hypothetical protein